MLLLVRLNNEDWQQLSRLRQVSQETQNSEVQLVSPIPAIRGIAPFLNFHFTDLEAQLAADRGEQHGKQSIPPSLPFSALVFC
jgi:hypothetical protein